MAAAAPRLLRALLANARNYSTLRRTAAKITGGIASPGRSSSGSAADNLTVNFVNRNGETLTATAKEGESLLEVVIRHHLNIDGFGACEGTLACSTCHLLFDQKHFDQLGAISDEELDMLDLAFGLTETSRLGCQICMTKAIDGMTVRVPTDVADARGETVGQQSQQ